MTVRKENVLLTESITGRQLTALINYLIQAGETSDAEAFVRNLAQRVPQHGDKLMTIAQQLEQKGIEKGIKQGIEDGIEKGIRQGIQLGEQQGLQKGKREAALEIAGTMLRNGIDCATVMKMTGLAEEDLTQLRH